jgi:hypothetical protein
VPIKTLAIGWLVSRLVTVPVIVPNPVGGRPKSRLMTAPQKTSIFWVWVVKPVAEAVIETWVGELLVATGTLLRV